ncbi:MAG: heavy-metal-associated domain-containing protein [Acholeplasmatales bacterium]|nr:heavy-metal-associated domain-containing protein [Acholeplasmatales bacterium]
MEKKILIEGMKCSGCANRVNNALKSIKGIKKIDVNLENKCANITYKKDITNEELTKAIEDLGFKVVGIE